MRKPAAGLFAVFVLLAASTASAQVLSVSYLEGQAQVRSGSAWRDLSIGDVVSFAASVRLETAAYLQLKGTNADFLLTRPGTYAVRDVLAARSSISAQGVGAALANSLRYLSALGSITRQSAAMGVRGGERGELADDEWVESSAEVFLEAGREYIRSGQNDMALDQLSQALQLATDDETPEIRFYLAYTHSLEGKLLDAWKQADGLNPGKDDEWRGNFMLLKARLLIDSSAYSEAVSYLTNEGRELAQDSQRASLYFFLLGLAYRGEGDNVRSDQFFSRTVQISAQSELGKSAAGLLQSP